jgi:heme-degrading monooxygenase HmoA
VPVFARVTRTEGASPEALEERVSIARERVLPKARELDGFKGVVALGDRESGAALLIVFWEDEQSLKASAEQAGKLRSETYSADESETSVEAFEVMMLDLDA